jgi:hypothetical protein
MCVCVCVCVYVCMYVCVCHLNSRLYSTKAVPSFMSASPMMRYVSWFVCMCVCVYVCWCVSSVIIV